MPSLQFRALVSYAIKSHRIGWYATRQSILKNGGTMQDVAWVLCYVLKIQSVAPAESLKSN